MFFSRFTAPWLKMSSDYLPAMHALILSDANPRFFSPSHPNVPINFFQTWLIGIAAGVLCCGRGWPLKLCAAEMDDSASF